MSLNCRSGCSLGLGSSSHSPGISELPWMSSCTVTKQTGELKTGTSGKHVSKTGELNICTLRLCWGAHFVTPRPKLQQYSRSGSTAVSSTLVVHLWHCMDLHWLWAFSLFAPFSARFCDAAAAHIGGAVLVVLETDFF